jgi:hypothetical protein
VPEQARDYIHHSAGRHLAAPIRLLEERRFDPPRAVLVEHSGFLVAGVAAGLAALR